VIRRVSPSTIRGVFNDSVPGVVVYINKVDSTRRTLTGIVVSTTATERKADDLREQGYVNIDSDTFQLYFMLQDGTSIAGRRHGHIPERQLSGIHLHMNHSRCADGNVSRKLAYEMDRND
jgi:hypothetical protein